MKLRQPAGLELQPRLCANRERAFTLIEMVTTSAIFSIVVLAMVYTQVFGLRQDELAQSKLGASDASRKGFDQLALDIRSAKTWSVGNMVSSTYTPYTNGEPQVGAAIQLCLTTNTGISILYYFVTNQGKLYRVHSNSSPVLICKNLTNNMYFQAEDYRGVVQTTLSHKCVIHTMLQFAQYQYPLTLVGPGYFYDYYKIELRLTPHVPDGP